MNRGMVEQENREHMVEHVTKDGRVYSLACGPLVRARYINPKLERELVDFKVEVEDKFNHGETKGYMFPKRRILYNNNHLKSHSPAPIIREESRSPAKAESPNAQLREYLR